MKRILAVCAAFWMASGLAAAAPLPSAAALFQSGNEAYAAGKYEDAARDYRQLISQGADTAAVRYNLGAALYRTGQLGAAILEMEKAARRSPQDQDIQGSLDFLQGLTLDRTTGSTARTTTFFIERLLAMTTPGQDAAAFAAVWIACCIVLALYQISRSYRLRRGALWLLALLAVPLVLMGSSVALKSWLEASRRQAVVLADKVDVRSGPEAENTTLFTIHEGLKVRLRGSQGSWTRISLENGLSGWVEGDTLGTI